MTRFVGLDVSQKLTAICVVDETGRRLWRGQCATDPGQIERMMKGHAGEDARIGLETGPMTPWLVHELRGRELNVVCLDARHASAALKMQLNKTDQNDAEGLAQIMRNFLLAIAAANLVILLGVWRSFRHYRRSGRLDEGALDMLVAGRGRLARLFRPLFRAITRGWHMYPLGFLFGLGFDTATEIGLLGISATQASQGMSPWQAMVFPALFTAGMAMVDTADSVLMVGAYGWAFVNPLRKLWYNLTITAASVLVALLIGGVEALGLLGDQLALTGPFWDAVGSLNDSLGYLGFAVVGIFVLCWAASTIIYRWQGYDRLDASKLG